MKDSRDKFGRMQIHSPSVRGGWLAKYALAGGKIMLEKATSIATNWHREAEGFRAN